jgi:hypothetical protein
MAVDYSNYIQDVVEPLIVDTVFNRGMEELYGLFVKGTPKGGDKITQKVRTAWTSNVDNYTTSDSTNPASSSQTLVTATWDKLYTHATVEIENIEINEARNGGADLDLVKDAILQETKALMNKIFVNCMTQIKADVDSTSAYSDAALDRSTYPTLASYEEDTDTPITVDLWRGMVNGTTLLKNTGPLAGYVALVEQAVYNKFRPLAAALNSWNINDASAGASAVMGYQELGNFEGANVVSPVGMTTGDVLLLRRQDVVILEHRPLEVEQVASGKDSVKFVLRAGVNAYVNNPGFQGKMTDKD